MMELINCSHYKDRVQGPEVALFILEKSYIGLGDKSVNLVYMKPLTGQ